MKRETIFYQQGKVWFPFTFEGQAHIVNGRKICEDNLRRRMDLRAMASDTGQLLVQVFRTGDDQPVRGANITITYRGDPENVIFTTRTGEGGFSPGITLPAPPLQNSTEPGDNPPYNEYNVRVEAAGYRTITMEGVEVMPGEVSIQKVAMVPVSETLPSESVIVIPENTLSGDFPPKIPESEVKPMDESGEIVLSRVVIPEYIIVHDGAPSDSTARDYYVLYPDYIKNVASSEIYATWPDATIRANVLAIMSFTLNRVYTEWYRNRGYDFTITSSTAYDQKWSYGRTIFQNISQIVDEMLPNYLSRPNVRQPILTQYCDGRMVSCPNWMTQWGSKELGDQGYSAIEILRYFYGNNMFINTAQQITGIPSSWPGSNLTQGSRGTKVTQLQEQLNAIAGDYPALPKVQVDGIYGPRTAEAVRDFQGVFGLPQTGVVDYPTWYKISQVFVGVTGIAELV